MRRSSMSLLGYLLRLRRLLRLGLDLPDRVDQRIEGQHGRSMPRLVAAYGGFSLTRHLAWSGGLTRTRPARSKRIEDGDPGGLEIRHVARDDGEPVFERRGRDHEIGAVVAE